MKQPLHFEYPPPKRVPSAERMCDQIPNKIAKSAVRPSDHNRNANRSARRRTRSLGSAATKLAGRSSTEWGVLQEARNLQKKRMYVKSSEAMQVPL